MVKTGMYNYPFMNFLLGISKDKVYKYMIKIYDTGSKELYTHKL